VNMPAKAPSERRPGLPAVVDDIVARAMREKPADRYATAAEFADDLRRCLAEVEAAQPAMAARAGDGDTVPMDGAALPRSAERMELRPSREFDAADGLSRLSVMPADVGTESRAGWTVQLARPRRRLDRASVMLFATYGVAVLLAVAIVVL